MIEAVRTSQTWWWCTKYCSVSLCILPSLFYKYEWKMENCNWVFVGYSGCL